MLRIAYFSNFSPKKLGTGENRIVAMAVAARDRGHSFTLFGRTPVHTDVSAARHPLLPLGGRWMGFETARCDRREALPGNST